MLHDRRILLIISGGIAAYKSLDLIRRLRDQFGIPADFLIQPYPVAKPTHRRKAVV